MMCVCFCVVITSFGAGVTYKRLFIDCNNNNCFAAGHPVSWHSLLRTGGFCWSRYLLPASP